jgi:hypothetical protein
MRSRARIMIGYREVHIDSPMIQPKIIAPDFGFHLAYATDLYQRAYVLVEPTNLEKTIAYDAALYSAPDPGGGAVPDADSTWTLIAPTQINIHHGQEVTYRQQDPAWFDGLVFVGLWTWVYQPSHLWTGTPFAVRHELWGNAHRWTRATPEDNFGRGPSYAMDRTDLHFQLQTKATP